MVEFTPAFFDIFGFFVFVFLIVLSVYMFKTKKLPSKWAI